MTVTDPYLGPPPQEEDGYETTQLPQNREAEQAVLGSMMMSRTTILDVTRDLQPKDFYRPAHEMIYTVNVDMDSADKPVDAITVGDELQKRGILRRCGGQVYLHELVAHALPANAPYYAEVIHDAAVRRRLAEAGQKITQLALTEGDSTDVINAAEAELEAVLLVRDQGVQKEHPWAVHDLAEVVVNGDDTQETRILQRSDGFALLYQGSFHSLAAEPESGKSWAAMIGCAQELCAGERVTYVDWEDRPGRIVSRLKLLGVPDQVIVERFRYIRPIAPIDQIGHSLLDHAAVTSTLVVLDGITEAMTLQGLDLNSQNDVAHFIHAFPKRLSDLGPAVLQIDHLPKTTEDGNRFAIGAQHKLAGLDGAAYMMKVIEPFGRGKTGRARLTVAKDREGYVREQAVGHTIGELVLESHGDQLMAYIEPPRSATRSSDGTFRPTILMEKVSRYVELNPDSSGNQIITAVQGKRSGLQDALRILVLESYLNSEPGPRGSVLYRSLNVYRQDSDPLVNGQDFTPPSGF
jgi:hypothetical protein